jgi:uncharacterized protein affecting Mg2+/Co2+ transport
MYVSYVGGKKRIQFTHCLSIQKRSGEEVKILGNKWLIYNTEAVQKKRVTCTDFIFWKIFIQI